MLQCLDELVALLEIVRDNGRILTAEQYRLVCDQTIECVGEIRTRYINMNGEDNHE